MCLCFTCSSGNREKLFIFLIFFFNVRSALISGDSAGCVISFSSPRAVNNLHSRLLVARRSPSPGSCRIKEGVGAVGSASAGGGVSHQGDFFFSVSLMPRAPFFYCAFMSRSSLTALKVVSLTANARVFVRLHWLGDTCSRFPRTLVGVISRGTSAGSRLPR